MVGRANTVHAEIAQRGAHAVGFAMDVAMEDSVEQEGLQGIYAYVDVRVKCWVTRRMPRSTWRVICAHLPDTSHGADELRTHLCRVQRLAANGRKNKKRVVLLMPSSNRFLPF